MPFPYVEYIKYSSTSALFQCYVNTHDHISITQYANQYFTMGIFKYKIYFYDLYWKYFKYIIAHNEHGILFKNF